VSLFYPPPIRTSVINTFLDDANDANRQRPALRNLLARLFGKPALVYFSLPPSTSSVRIQDGPARCCPCC